MTDTKELPLSFENNFADVASSVAIDDKAVSVTQKQNGEVLYFDETSLDVKPGNVDGQQLNGEDTIFTSNPKAADVLNANNTASGNLENVKSLSVGSNKPDTGKENPSLGNKEKEFLLAASLVEDAVHGRTLDYLNDQLSLRAYQFYSKPIFQVITICFMWLLLSLALFEAPAVPGLEIPYWGTMIIEIVCLGVIAFRLYQMYMFVPRRTFVTDTKNVTVAVVVLVTVIDMIVYLGMGGSGIRVSRCLRPLFMINMNESRQVRRAFRNIRNTVPEILNVLVLFLFSIAVFTLLAHKLFDGRNLLYRGEEPYFTNYWDSFFDLYVLVTTANSPDVMMPAYDYSGWFAIYFIFYIIINTYIFMNLFLAVIYNSYRTHLKTEIRGTVLLKRKKLEQAFNLLYDVNANGIQVVSYESWMTVMKLLTSPPSYIKINLYWEVLTNKRSDDTDEVENSNEDSGIAKAQFLQVANLLNVYVVEDASGLNWFKRNIPTVYNSRISCFICMCVSHRLFAAFFDLVIIANAFCIGFDVEVAEWYFLSAFVIEIALRIYLVGPKEFFSYTRTWNWFDFIIITAALIATIIEASLNELDGFPREVLDVILVLRCLRLVRIAGSVHSIKIVVMTIANIMPSLLTYGVVLLMLYYFFAIIGMESFAGLIQYVDDGTTPMEHFCGNDDLKESEFIRMGYCNNNFNDLIHSLVTLVVLTVVNQWHIITLGYTLVTSKWARLYFVLFHLIVVILIMNIIVAFVLEAFILEYGLSKTTIESKLEKTIQELGYNVDDEVTDTVDDETELVDEVDGAENATYTGKRDATRSYKPKIKFRINEGHKNIEVLLQKMFEDELGVEATEGPAPTETLTFDDVTGDSTTI